MIRLLTLREAASVARCSPEFLRAQIAVGDLGASKIGNGWKIDEAELERWIRDRSRPTGYVEVPGVKGLVRLADLPAEMRKEFGA